MSLSTVCLVLAVVGCAEANPMQWNRRLQAVHSDACKAACPKVTDLVSAVDSVGDDPAKIIQAMCPYEATVSCVYQKSECQDAETAGMAEIVAQMPCMCACPTLGTKEKAGELSKAAGDEPTAEQCKGIFNCVSGTSKCEAVQKEAAADPKASKQMEYCKSTHSAVEASEALTRAPPIALLVLSVTTLFA